MNRLSDKTVIVTGAASGLGEATARLMAAEGATVVGIPGRIICKEEDVDCREKQRQAMAEKIGFDAYGMTPDMPDPIARSIRKLLDHMHAVDQKVNQMSVELEKMGRDCGQSLPEIDDQAFDTLAEVEEENRSQLKVD